MYIVYVEAHMLRARPERASEDAEERRARDIVFARPSPRKSRSCARSAAFMSLSSARPRHITRLLSTVPRNRRLRDALAMIARAADGSIDMR